MTERVIKDDPAHVIVRGEYRDQDGITRYWVFISITPAEALRWIAEEAGKPERIWERLFDACRAEVRLMHPLDWEMQGQAVDGGVKVEFWRKE